MMRGARISIETVIRVIWLSFKGIAAYNHLNGFPIVL